MPEKNKNLIRRFEILILRPIYIPLLALIFLFATQGMWLWLIAPFAGWFYLGVIGAALHPLQTASQLSMGPLSNSAAINESRILSDGDKLGLVSPACTKVGMLIGFLTAIFLITFSKWHWYFAFLLGLFLMVMIGGVLKFVFVRPS